MTPLPPCHHPRAPHSTLTPLPPGAGVADQLQTNFASDLRSILKTVFKIVASQAEPSEEPGASRE